MTTATTIVMPSRPVMIDPKAIVRKAGFNPRFDFGEIDMLAKSIKANGLLQPIRVKRVGAGEAGPFELIDGDRRFTAIELLIKQGNTFEGGVAAFVAPKAQDDMTSLFQMFESNTGKAFLPLEEAAAYKRMQDAGLTIKQICERVGRAQMHIVTSLALLDADADVQEAVKEGKVSATTAKQIAVHARGDKAKQKELIAEAKAAGKDKAKRVAVQASIEAQRQSKNKAKGKTLKLRAMTDDQLAKRGIAVSAHLESLMEELGHKSVTDVAKWIPKHGELRLAAAYGALQALKAAAGVDSNLEF